MAGFAPTPAEEMAVEEPDTQAPTRPVAAAQASKPSPGMTEPKKAPPGPASASSAEVSHAAAEPSRAAGDPFAVPELKNRGQVRAYADLLDIKGQNLWVALRITKIEDIDLIGPQEAGQRLRAFFDTKRTRLEAERDSTRR